MPGDTEHVPEQRSSVRVSEVGCGTDHRALFSVPSRANMDQWLGLVLVRSIVVIVNVIENIPNMCLPLSTV